MKAIIAEDEIHLADDLQRRLRRLWPELEIAAIAHDGEAATAALAEHDPDVAFLDIRMPGRSGLEVAHSAPARCRVVFVTAYDEHAVQAFEQGGFLQGEILPRPRWLDPHQEKVEQIKAAAKTFAAAASPKGKGREHAPLPGQQADPHVRLAKAPDPEDQRRIRPFHGSAARRAAIPQAGTPAF